MTTSPENVGLYWGHEQKIKYENSNGIDGVKHICEKRGVTNKKIGTQNEKTNKQQQTFKGTLILSTKTNLRHDVKPKHLNIHQPDLCIGRPYSL